MKLKPVTLLMVLFLVAVPAAFADEAREAIHQPVVEMPSTEVGIPVLQTEDGTPVFLAAGGHGKGKTQRGIMSSSPSANSLSRAFCDWFDISCSNGTTEECCGSVASCGVFCEETCGEPCIHEDPH